MASKTVSDLKIKVGLQGEETFSRLKGQFRALEKTVGVTDKGIQELRRGVLEFSRAGGKSTQLINGQIQALKGLQAQTTINSGTYKKLTRDIEALNSELGQLDGSVTKVKNNLGSFQIPGYASDKFATAIQARRQELQGLAVDSREYLEQLTNIRAFERRQGFITGRQEVAAAAAAARRTMPERAMAVGLPDTYAGLRQRISELTAEIDHLEIGSDELRNAENELIATQRALSEVLGQTSAAYDELANKEQGAIRRAKKLADIQEYYRTQGPLAPGVGGFRDPVTGAMIAGGTRAGIVPLRQGTFRGDNIFPASNAVDMMAARRAAVARPPMGARGYAQVAGAALSGGIFGGPEGLLGGLAGGIVGGPSGAFAGAAIGAQGSMLRQSLGATADYAASIEKLQIALKGVAGSQQEYQKALATAASATERLNVPQETAIQGMTRLTAAVTGAGGKVGDASVVFNNVTAAIKATGGGAQDVESAITAMVQVFSKGKVSAEELSGQLGERLPGAVTMFAEANKMTLPELQKNLRDGTVGLNELMKFIEALGVKYQGTAAQIATSNAEAGARLTIAINQMRLEVGKALQPIGAEFQNAFAGFIKDITPQLVAAAKAVGQGLKFIIDNAQNIKNIAQFAATLGLVNLAMKAFVAMNGPISTAFLAIQAGFARTSQQAIVAQMKISAAMASLKAFALAAAAPIAITIVLYGLQKIIQARQELARLKKQAGMGAEQAFAGASRETVVEAQAKQKGYLPSIQKAYDDAKKAYDDFKANPLAQYGALGLSRNEALYTALQTKEAELKFTKDVLKLDPSKYTSTARGVEPITDFASPKPDGEDGKGKGKVKMAQEELNLRDRIRAAIFKEKELERILAEYRLDSYLATLETEDPLKRENMLREAISKFEQEILKYRKDQLDKQEEAKKKQDEILKKEREFNSELQDRKFKLGLINEEEYNRLLIERERARLKEAYPDMDAGRIDESVDAYRQEIDPTPFEEMRQNIMQLKQELNELLNPVNQIVGAAGTIGQAFSTSFINVINGSQTTQEALAGFFKNIGNYFLDMAAQIIAKMIQMAILNAVVGLLPGAGGGGLNIASAASGAGAGYGGGAASGLFGGGSSVKGYSFGGGGNFAGGFGAYLGDTPFTNLPFLKRAYGGPVKGKMPYLVGENGPELYVPGMSGKIVPNHKLPKMVDLGGKFMPFHPLFMAAMFGLGNFGGNRQAVMEMFGAKFSPYSGGAMVGRAAGGPVTGGSPYLVGESGPEMYVPQGFSAGSMKSTSNNVVVNVNASGSQAEGDGPDSKRLGEAIGAAVRQELMRQQRPGGILA